MPAIRRFGTGDVPGGAEILWIAVDAARRGHGHGTRLVGHGFIHIDTIDPLPGWRPGNPAAIYVAAVHPIR